jgi:signal transduction histidine kinase
VNPTYIDEINNDIQRLETITERFSKIGSMPQLTPTDIVMATKTSIQYLQSRSSQLVSFDIKLPSTAILVHLNEELYNWTIENLVKNGIDAMKGKGQIGLELKTTTHQVISEITDNGSGIAKKQFKAIFETGYTTKKRGWGLGLSLTKRIVEQYHNGKIKVLSSEIDKGTTIQIALKKITDN